MKLLGILIGSALYGAAVYFVALMLALQCGMGPDSAAACNDEADLDVTMFLVGAALFYTALSFFIWRRWRLGVR